MGSARRARLAAGVKITWNKEHGITWDYIWGYIGYVWKYFWYKMEFHRITYWIIAIYIYVCMYMICNGITNGALTGIRLEFQKICGKLYCIK